MTEQITTSDSQAIGLMGEIMFIDGFNRYGVIGVAVHDHGIITSYRYLTPSDEGHILSNFLDRKTKPREDYDETLGKVKPTTLTVEDVINETCKYIAFCVESGWPVDAVGVSTFGVIDPKTGIVIGTSNQEPKKGIPVRHAFKDAIKRAFPNLDLAILLENDASAATFGEFMEGAGMGHGHAFAFISLGRGINGGLVLNNGLWSGTSNTEFTHVPCKPYKGDEVMYDDVIKQRFCSAHGDCLLGLASRRAIEFRVDAKNDQGVAKLGSGQITDIYGHYIAQLCYGITLTISPARIALGGSMLGLFESTASLMERVHWHFETISNGFPTNEFSDSPENYIIPGKLGIKAGIIGIFHRLRMKFDQEGTSWR